MAAYDILADQAEMIVIPVNTQPGVMGAGLAKQAADAYPRLVEAHALAAAAGTLAIGRVALVDLGEGRRAALLATKDHWRDPSQVAYIERGMRDLRAQLDREPRPPSLAIPRLGAGLGGLDWERDAQPAIVAALAGYQGPIRLDGRPYTPRRESPADPAPGEAINFVRADRETWGFLSNFHPAPIMIAGCSWPSVEHYYQSRRTTEPAVVERIRAAPTAATARKLGQKLPTLRPDWPQIKEAVMREAVAAKFAQHPDLRKRLLASADRPIREDAPWDSYWGTGPDGLGENRLGRILEDTRAAWRARDRENPTPSRPPPTADPAPRLIIAIVGSREGIPPWQTERAVGRAVTEAQAHGIAPTEILFRSGGAGRTAAGGTAARYPESVDRVGIDTARALGCRTREIAAQWERRDPTTGAILRDTHGAALIDRGAGFARNGAIIEGADLVIALTTGSPGTADTLAKAAAAGIPVQVAGPLPRTYQTHGAVPPNVVYMGRRPDKTPGEYGNPFPLAREADRPAVLANHADYALRRLAADPTWMSRARTASGGSCFCHGPEQTQGCHVDTNLRLLHRERLAEFPPNPAFDQALERARRDSNLRNAPALGPLLGPAPPLLPPAVLARLQTRAGRGPDLPAPTGANGPPVVEIAISKDYPLIGRAAATIKATLAKHPQACVALHGGGAVELGARLEGATLAIGPERPLAVGRLVFWAGTPDSTHTLLSLWRARSVGKLLAFGPQGERLPSERPSPPPPRSQPEPHREPARGGRDR